MRDRNLVIQSGICVSLELITRAAFFAILYPVTYSNGTKGPFISNHWLTEFVASLPFLWKMLLVTAITKRQVHLYFIT
jgi:hypothetical protein